MKSKKTLLITGVIMAVILIISLVLWPKQKPEVPEDSTAAETTPEPGKETHSPSVNPEQTPDPSKEDPVSPTPTPTPEPTPTPLPQPPEKPVVFTLPYTIPGSSLEIQNIRSFSGQYLEDGSDENVENIAVAILKNNGSSPIEYADIQLFCGNTLYNFKASDLPAGSIVVAQEANRTAYADGTYSNCTANIAPIDAFEISGQVSVSETESSLVIKNMTDKDIPCVRVFYKLYLSEESAYIGGITYTAKITDLKAGSERSVSPSHYLQGYSRIMMVRTYDTAD